MTYPSSLLEHLARYKREQLGIAEDGVWIGNGKPYPHLLPALKRDLNLLEVLRGPCLAYLERSGKRLHRDFHHLNSSQAFALNLFFPLLVNEAGKRALSAALELTAPIMAWEFEAVSRPDEETNFDLLLTLASGEKVYIEVKLTESAFGRATVNPRRLEKLDNIYRPQLRNKVVADMLEQRKFFKNYQLLRNLAYIDDPPGSRLLLIFPQANSHAKREAARFLNESLLPDVEERVSVLYAEDLMTDLLRELPNGEIADTLRLVIQKYALDGGTPTSG